MTRYALYFTPAATSSWWSKGCHWLGRDPVKNACLAQPLVPGITPSAFADLTKGARRYGWHATLKPPFRLADGFEAEHLLSMAEAFCAVQTPILLDNMKVGKIGDFLALRPAEPNEELQALAMRCVSYFDLLRAPPTAAELMKRRNAGLTPRQEKLLHRWGYPYTEEQFRFHMTLTDSLAGLDAKTQSAVRWAAEVHFGTDQKGIPLAVDALTIFREEYPGADFIAWRRFPFGNTLREKPLPEPGRLFYFVGPSGAGKDTLLQWVRQRIGDNAGTVFARRTITRQAHASELHEAVSEDKFWKLASAGHFAMAWQANGLCYGIRRGIEAELMAGRDVFVNGSREYVPQLQLLFPHARVIWIEADLSQIRARLQNRQRETGAALLRRLERASQFPPPDTHRVFRIENSGPIDIAGARLMNVLRRE